MRFEIVSVDTLMIYFKNEISLDISVKVKKLYEKLKSIEGLIDITPSYSSILVTYDIFKYDYENLVYVIKESIKTEEASQNFKSKTFEIPVYYGKEVGLDLEHISNYSKLSIEEVIQKHSSKTYHIYTIGFALGFAYLGNVDKQIATPRLKTPRKIVKKGSVAIADEQTAIYPDDSPGGWNIIGATTYKLYDKSSDELMPFKMGDKIKFYPISKKEYLASGGQL